MPPLSGATVERLADRETAHHRWTFRMPTPLGSDLLLARFAGLSRKPLFEAQATERADVDIAARLLPGEAEPPPTRP